MEKNLEFIGEQLKKLTAIPSPSSYTEKAAEYLMETLKEMGYEPELSNKGNVLVTIGGEGNPLVLASHIDTLGAMVRSIKDNGRLRPTTLGGHQWRTADGENCTVHTRDGRVYTGVVLNTCLLYTSVELIYAVPEMLVVLLIATALKPILTEYINSPGGGPLKSFANVLGPNLISMFIAFGLLYWVTMSRIIRGQVLQLKQQEYVTAARALGASGGRIIRRHLLPNCIGQIVVTTCLQIPSAIFLESFLSLYLIHI